MRFIGKRLLERRLRLHPNYIGAVTYPPGHYYSPLLDLERLGDGAPHLPFDGEEWWEHLDFREDAQRAYYEEILTRHEVLPFPPRKTADFRYFTDNQWFPASDAHTLSGIIQKEKPRRIIEVGSGFSSAVMLDTLQHTGATAELTFIEPNPERLQSLLDCHDQTLTTIRARMVQEIPPADFDRLEAQDVLFIDSSHVSKVGSDVSYIFLRILPRLKPGVIVHVHDVFYPYSYPAVWIREGKAWNESLFLRAFLIGNPQFQIMAFNSYAGQKFPALFEKRCPAYLENGGASIWLRKVA